MILTSLLLLACAPSDGADTAALAKDPWPEVWGVSAAEDHSTEPGLVEVELSAGLSTVQWVDEGETEVWSYDGQVPGPLIHANVGDTVRVHFENALPEDETTIHWHGLRIANEMDGVPAIQDPVQPGESFTYEFVVPDGGSYWYHPHVRSYEQIERGLQGLFVVHEPDQPTPARDRYFALDDAYLRNSGDFQPFRISHMTSMHGRFGNVLLVNGQPGELSDSVRPEAPERWRLVNTANARTMYATVSNARWRVIAIDGTLLSEPYETEQVRLPVGRRFDLEVIPEGDASEVQLVVQLPDGNDWADYPVFTGAVEGESGDGSWLAWNAPELPAMQDATQEVALLLDGASNDEGLIEWTINGATYEEHEDIVVSGHTPSLITIKERSGAEHPFHLHGQFFRIVERDDTDALLPGLLDTVLVSGDEKVVVYTEFDNPGRWMAHCHILEHAEMGMMTELVVEE